MQITFLNGNPRPDALEFEAYLTHLTQELAEQGAQVTTLTLRDLDIRYCVGCWGCWVKTPGECLSKDDSAQVCRAVIHSDLTVMASPLVMGYPSALMKKTMDKLIPLIHPYATLVQGEVHHVARYPRYPRLALLLEPEPDTDAEDLEIVRDLFSRAALNLKSSLSFTHLTTQPLEEALHAVNRL
jgi:hypothetical protein